MLKINPIISLWVYLIVSWLLLVFTSSGWTAIIMRFCILGLLMLIMGIVFTVKIAKNKIKRINLISIALILVQLLAISLNYGDCGDAQGGSSFFEFLFRRNRWEDCHQPYLGEMASTISALCIGLYIIVLCWVLSVQTKKN